MQSRSLHKPFFILALAACSARADYVNTTVSLGGYLLDAEDATHDGNFYQMERVNVSALKDGVGLHFAYGYSDFYEKRPNTYVSGNRLALANLSYDPGLGWLKVQAGRDFKPMIERSLYYDGGEARLQYRDKAQASLFGGFGVPTVYQYEVADLNTDRALIGGKVVLTPITPLLLQFDGLVNGKTDDGSLGGEVQGRLGDHLTLTGNSVFLLDSNYFQHAEAGALVHVRKNDQIQVRYGYQETKIDSTRNYDYFVNKAHQFALAGYVFSWSEKIRADFDYGLVIYDDTVGQLVDVKASLYGFFARVGQEFSTVANAFDVQAGYSNTYWGRLRIDLAGGYTRYDLDARKTGLDAFECSVQPTYLIGRGLEATLAYEYLHNRLYDRDQRFFLGVKESFFKGLSK